MKKNSIRDELNRTHYSAAQNVWFCIKNTAAFYPSLLLWCVIAVLINTALPVLTTYLPKIVIEKITMKIGVTELAVIILCFMSCIALLEGAKKFFQKYLFHEKFSMPAHYLKKFAIKSLTTDYSSQENAVFRKLQAESYNCASGNSNVFVQIYDMLIELFTGILGLSIFWAILSQLNFMVIAFLAATTAAAFFLHQKTIRWTDEHNQERIGYQQRFGYINRSSSDLRSAKDIRLYHMAKWFSDIYNENLKGMEDWYRRLTSQLFSVSVYDSGLALLREAAAYLYLLYLAWNDKISPADFVLYFGVILGFSTWLSSIFAKLTELNQWSLKINYFRSFLEFPESYCREGGLDIPSKRIPKEIELKNVSYKYEGSEEYTLCNVSLKIAAGEHLAVVGLNGAGKTTLVKLLCGLIDPTAGQVLYNGIDIREYNRSEFYHLFSAVFQQFSILPAAIEEIVAETPSERLDSVKVESCLKTAGLWNKIGQLPKGLKSQFGRAIYDDGVEFSGGEVQKLLLARALYRDAPLLVLDEPTAALDPIAESILYQNYNQISEGKTAVFISHRLASTSFCDRVILIENGAVCEEGSHASLLEAKGKYYKLFEMQARYYREELQNKGVEE